MDKFNKPTISDLTSAESTISNINKDIDRSHLSDLYPSPKTYEDIKRDDITRQQTYRSRWPKFPYLNIAAYGSVIAGVFLWFVQNIGAWWFSTDNRGAVMSIVFFSFVLGLAIMGLIIAWVRYVNKQFSYFTGPVSIFWLIYTMVTGMALTLSLSGLLWPQSSIIRIPVFVGFHFIITLLTAKATLKSNSPQRK